MWIKISLSQDPTERAAMKSLETCLAMQNTKALGSGKEALQNLFCHKNFLADTNDMVVLNEKGLKVAGYGLRVRTRNWQLATRLFQQRIDERNGVKEA
ncbi:MAG: hypothetical protein HY266_06545 [Deltaproteobacteria bacterium]|nr:hypothetical protein [Deltaproteobacteria bacterium]